VRLLHDWIDSLPNPAANLPSVDYTKAVAELNKPELSDDQRIQKVDQLLNTASGALSVRLAIDRGAIPETIKPLLVSRGTSSPEAHIRDLFEKYLPEDQRPKRLGNVIHPADLLAIKGDLERGRQLFFNTSGVQCRNCHQIQGQGTAIGPDLSQVGKKYDRAKVLDNILNPSREIDPKFVVYLVQTRDGKLHSGLMIERTESVVVLKDAKNQLIRLPAGEVEDLTPQQQSLMPDLLLRDLTAQQVADLVSFLSSLR
jgi:putative heme-binding domain-containing protein